MLTWCHWNKTFSIRVMRNVCGNSTISWFSVKSSGHSGRPSLLFPAASKRQFPAAPSLLHEFAGFTEVDESCRGDVEEEPVLEPDDSPGTTKKNVVLSLAEDCLPSSVRCGF